MKTKIVPLRPVKIGKKCILTRTKPTKLTRKGFEYETESFEVVLLAVSGIHAMVRSPGCIPFVHDDRELTAPISQQL